MAYIPRMFDRRSILKLFGLGGAAVAMPVAAAPVPKIEPVRIEHPLHEHFLNPIDAFVHMKGGKVYEYRAHRHPDVQSVRVSFHIWKAGIIEKVVLKRHGVELITVYQSAMDTPFATQGATINIDITGRPL